MEPEELTFQEIKEITDGFAQELGHGSFGVVYKGLTKTGKDVAVKVLLNHINIDYKQFHNEFNSLAMLQHPNIVQLLGYCYETERKPMKYNGRQLIVEETHRVLCLEYLHNGSLQKYLSDEVTGLDWNTRYKVIKGTCEGLKYIHEELEQSIYHLDLKPDNILLDKDMEPKIADFGLSKIFGDELKRTTQSPLGTLGYQPPEYIDKGEISKKFDIFSLGVIMIMIVSGRDSIYEDMSNDKIIDIVRKWRNRLQATWSGSSLEAYCHQVETCTKIALNCMQQDSQKRPNVLQIIDELNKIETAIGKVPQKECSKTVPWMTTQDQMKMRKQLRQMADQHQHFNLLTSDRYNDLESVDIHKKSSDVAEDFIIGRTDEKKIIIDSLIEAMTEKIIILPIYGIGGIGKTTFARLIYNDANFRFYSQVWVHVSPIFDLKKIGDSIISQLPEKQRQTKKNLIVLDDLWEDNPFLLEDLKVMLNLGDSINTIVLVTTRSEHVAEKICTNIKPYKIKHLTNDMCWEIIKQRSAFETRDDKKYLTSIGKDIALKCGGVALAAQSVGFMLQSMKSSQWMEVKNNNIWKESISDDASLQNQVLASLKLTYSYMDSCLKPCFTYCAMFPKGQKIHKDDLIQQWISLGFIKPTEIHSIMELCEKYVVQLLGLSFLQHSMSAPTYEGAYREKQDTLFTMHDLVHDLAVLLLGDEIMDQRQQGNTLSSSCRYALLTDSSKPLELCLSSCARLTALRFIDCRRTELCGAAFAPANFLRVLDLRECHIQKLPESIGQLQQLSYLKAPEIQDQLIPDCITQLSKLNYLYISGSEISALPESIGEMAGLVHLDISFCSEIEQLPLSFRNLENLVHLDLSHCSLITGVSESLGSLRRLQHLDLRWCTSIGEELPGALGSLTELQYLNLSHCSYLEVPDAEVLGNLNKLKYLNLSSASSPLRRLPESLGSFTELEYLNLSGCRQLEELPASFGKLCSLVHLNLSYCWCLNNIWDALRDLTKLQCLELHQCSIDVFRQRQHVSSKFLHEAMSNLTELRFLSLSDSLYLFSGGQSVCDSFLGWISNLTNLEQLDLSSNNELHILPDAFGELKKLHTLDLSYCCNLLWLPKSISEIDSLKFLHIMLCNKLDKTTLPQFKRREVILPHFVVRTGDGEPSSNLVLLKDEDPTDLEISRLENVKSVEEAQMIKLLDKRTILDLKFEWTRDAKRFVEDIGVMTELVPPSNLEDFLLQGYNSLTFPSWMMCITSYLPQLRSVSLKELPRCSTLPPLGQLPNLSVLKIEQMHSIRKIGGDLYGGTRAFPALKQFYLAHMDNLQEWNTIGYSDQDGANVLVLPMLSKLVIEQCPILRFKPCPPIGGDSCHTGSSYKAILSWGETVQVEACFPFSLLHQCRLVLHLPALEFLYIEDCSGLTSSSLDILRGLSSLLRLKVFGCKSITAFPECLGDLTSLMQLWISNCTGIKRLPESIKQLTNLQDLYVSGCPELVQWCNSDEKIMKLLRTSK